MRARSVLTVAALTAAGVALRWMVAQQSLFADELSTHYVVAGRSLVDAVSVVHTDAEITPPLYFVLAWLTTQIGDTPALLRAPSLLAGAAAIPLVYLVGVRTVGRRAALVATALAAFSPFLIYYSAEARGYELMIVLVLLSTLAVLAAVDSGRTRWWIAYAACACAAVYTHYTSVFALGGQLAWVLWAHPAARRPALAATAAAVVGFLPWLTGLEGDLESTTTDILSALQPFTPTFVRQSLTHWAIGYPYATPISRLRDLPGIPVWRSSPSASSWRWPDTSARAGAHGSTAASRSSWCSRSPSRSARPSSARSARTCLGTRNLAASWPAFALCVAAFLVSAGPRIGTAAAGLAWPPTRSPR